MLSYLLISLSALLTAGLTLFSGFGLGTLLLPVFAVFFPIELAVALAAVVHLANNLFKLALLGKDADRPVVLRFGLPAILAALLGARVLLWLGDLSPIYTYTFLDRTFVVMPVKVVVAGLMVIFALAELAPTTPGFSFDRRYLPLGGLLSGFFGGLSGHQGALRSAFLLRCDLTKEAFIATGVTIACLVDLSRLFVYFGHFALAGLGETSGMLLTAILSAFAGSFLGSRLVPKVTMRAIQLLVSGLLFAIAMALGGGLI